MDDYAKAAIGNVDGDTTLRYSPELNAFLLKDNRNPKEFLKNNISDSLNHLEIVGWSSNGQLKSSLYDKLFTSDLKVKKLTLRGRGTWKTCCCPKGENNNGSKLIDTVKPERTTTIEHIFIFRTFRITSCALLDLIARSPNLKSVRFYGSLIEESHCDSFLSVRFLSDLEGVYWPWCNAKTHKSTLRAIIKRNSQIQTLYTTSDIACDFINSDILPNLKYLSLIMNEKWVCSPGKSKVLKRYLKNINFLRKATKIEALEIRTFDVTLQLLDDQNGDPEIHDLIRNTFETYKIHFWENVRDLSNLKYLGIYGGWELEEVTREMSKHGLQIEYFRTSLMPNSILSNLEETDNRSKFLVLSLSDVANYLAKLAKLRSIHLTCHDKLTNIDSQTTAAMISLSDLIWRLDIQSNLTSEIEELITNILRRGNQNGRTYKVRLNIAPEDNKFANLYAEVIEKHTGQGYSLKENLTEFSQQRIRERFGKNAFKTYSIWGISQHESCRDKEAFNQLASTWSFYEELFRPYDRFI